MVKADRKTARSLYVKDLLPITAIAARLKVSERTVMRWKSDDAQAGDNWDKARTATRISKQNVDAATQGFLEMLLQYQGEVLEEVKTSADMSTQEKVAALTNLMDSFIKAVRACSLTAPTLNHLAIAMEVLQLLAAFVAEKHPEARQSLLAVLEPFGAELAKTYGKP